jgi:hypothetical protein
MNKIPKQTLLPAALAAGSFSCIILLTGLTSPINKIGWAMLFFLLLLVFLVSLGYLVATIQFGRVSSRTKFRIVIVSILILVAIMLRSVQSLNLIDLVVVGLISFGLLFYSSRRT